MAIGRCCSSDPNWWRNTAHSRQTLPSPSPFTPKPIRAANLAPKACRFDPSGSHPWLASVGFFARIAWRAVVFRRSAGPPGCQKSRRRSSFLRLPRTRSLPQALAAKSLCRGASVAVRLVPRGHLSLFMGRKTLDGAWREIACWLRQRTARGPSLLGVVAGPSQCRQVLQQDDDGIGARQPQFRRSY